MPSGQCIDEARFGVAVAKGIEAEHGRPRQRVVKAALERVVANVAPWSAGGTIPEGWSGFLLEN